MSKMYAWKNTVTGEILDTESYDQPPDNSLDWKRLYLFGVGSVSGAGGSPTRSSVKGSP